MALKKNRNRFGSSAFPLSGIGQFVHSPTKDVNLLLLSMSGVLATGIPLTDVGKFMASPEAARMLKEEPEKAFIMKVKAGGVAWIPYGFVTSPIFLGLTQATKHDLNHLLAIPVFHEQWAMKLPRETRQALHNFNLEHFKKQGSTNVEFGHRIELWKDFCQAIEVNVVDPELVGPQELQSSDEAIDGFEFFTS